MFLENGKVYVREELVTVLPINALVPPYDTFTDGYFPFSFFFFPLTTRGICASTQVVFISFDEGD
jgi:hypothetical protein